MNRASEDEHTALNAELSQRINNHLTDFHCSYSLELGFSEELLEDMARKGYWCEELSPLHYENEYWSKNGFKGQYKATFHKHHGCGMRGFSYGETRALARAKAALMTLRHEAGIYD